MRIICISDIHISTKWIGNLSIIEQSVTLAEKLVAYCKAENIRYLFICGDIVDKAIDRPEVYHTVQKVFEIFSAYFTAIYYILGQHDLAVIPTSFIQVTDTILTSLKIPNLYYANNQIIELGGRSIGMANFNRDSSYKFDRNVDLYLTHFTISSRFGQVIDNSRFTYMIAGDIHHPQNIGNMYSIGSFQQQSVLRDSVMNCAIVVDLDNMDLSRVDLSAGLKLLSSEIHSGMVDGVWYELRRGNAPQVSNPLVSKLPEDSSNVKIVELVAKYLADFNLSEVHSDVANQISNYRGFSTEFKILSFEIYNFLKLRHFKIEFNEKDQVLLTGKNGAGKSTLLDSIFSALTGNITWSNFQGAFDEEVYSIIKLFYNGNIYELRRGSHEQYLKVNTEPIGFKNRNDFPSVVLGHLPFLSELGILFQRPQVGTLFEGITSNQKLDLISKVYNLSYLDALYTSGESIKKNYVSKLNEVAFSIKANETKLKEVLTKLEEYRVYEAYNYEEFKGLSEELTDRQTKALAYQSVSSDLLKYEASIENLNSLIDTYQSELDALDSVKYESDLAELNRLTDSKSKSEKVTKELKELKDKLDTIEKELKSLEDNKCPRCSQLMNAELAQAEIAELNKSKGEVTTNYTNKYNESVELSSIDLSKIPEYTTACNTYISSKSEKSNLITSLGTKVAEEVRKKGLLDLPEKFEFSPDDLIKLTNTNELLDKISKYKELKSDFDEVSLKLSKDRSDYESYKGKVDELGLYNWYVCKSGPIYKDIITSLCEEWSNDRVKFELFEGDYRGNPYLDISISYLKGRNWQPYSKSSSGEKSYMDVLFIKSVTANAGMLILDEFLRHMDPEVTELTVNEIKGMNVNLFILSSFNENLYFSNRHIKAHYEIANDECICEED